MRRSGPSGSATASRAATAHPDLGVLLATSGSTGNPKLVRLSRAAVLANAASIIEALGINGDDVAISSLPFYYSYGMSVLNTHLRPGRPSWSRPAGLVAAAVLDRRSRARG